MVSGSEACEIQKRVREISGGVPQFFFEQVADERDRAEINGDEYDEAENCADSAVERKEP